MNRRILALFFAGLLFLSACGAETKPQNDLNIAVMVYRKEEAAQYLKGIELAASVAQKEYQDYNIKYSVYEDFDDYETGAGIVDAIASDPSVTAVLLTENMDIGKLAVHEFEAAGKLTILPFALYDSELSKQKYELVFSTCFSAKQAGETARVAAQQTGVKKWAVLYSGDDFSRQEARSFTAQKSDDIVIADMVKEEVLLHDFPVVTKRWQQLGVEGIALYGYDSTVLNLFIKLKQFNPAWKFVGDFVMDDPKFMASSPEHKAAFEGFSLVSQFYIQSDEKEREKLQALFPSADYVADNWLIHGYNNFKMIVDTAVKNETTDPEKMAYALRLVGYDGLLQTFSFDKTGQLDHKKIAFDVWENGMWKRYEYSGGGRR